MAYKAKHMTPSQKRFADEWLKDQNGSRAYKAAYPAVKKDVTAAAAATRLLKNVNIAAYIDKRQKTLQKIVEVSQERVLQEEKHIGLAAEIHGFDFLG